jgi:hypothetical protein
MTQATARKLPHLAPEHDDYLGPAEVVAVEAGAVTVELPGGPAVEARLALALPYEPAIGDVLLVIGKGGAHYVIGVLHGAGRTALALHGDVALHAVDGTLSLTGDKGVEVRGPEIDVQTGKLRMVADAVVQKFASVWQRVSSVLSVHAGQTHTVVDGGTFAQSKSATILTEQTVTINGKEIYLG